MGRRVPLRLPPIPFGHPDYSKNADRTGMSDEHAPCAWCGRKVRDDASRYWACVADGGSRFIPIADAAREEEEEPGSYMGFWAVGPECAKLFPPGYLHRGSLLRSTLR
jgi:hypothetical protein